jgi:hypothetical protein
VIRFRCASSHIRAYLPTLQCESNTPMVTGSACNAESIVRCSACSMFATRTDSHIVPPVKGQIPLAQLEYRHLVVRNVEQGGSVPTVQLPQELYDLHLLDEIERSWARLRLKSKAMKKASAIRTL